MIESIFGSLVGGLFRLAPEFMKIWDRKNERRHEAAMMELEIKAAEQQAAFARQQAEVAMTTAELEAMAVALSEQGKTATAAGKFVSAVSALVRPLVTYWMVFMYSLVKLATYLLAVGDEAADWKQVLVACWTKDDWAILSLILTFWFVGRVWERKVEPQLGF